MKTLSLLAFLSLLTGLTFAQNKNPATIVVTPQNPLYKKEIDFRKKISKWSDSILNSTDYKNIKAQPSSATFPGEVKNGYQFVDRTITINHKKIVDSLLKVVSTLGYSGYNHDTMYSTGLYAVAGEYIEVDVPKDASNAKVQIGAHTDRLNYWVAGEEDWRRMPIITKTQKLKRGKNRLTSPFGGLIYINFPYKDASINADFTVKHAVTSPLFVLGKTSFADWQVQLKNNKAPWGELATENIILTLPDSVLQTIKNPDTVMRLWDLIIEGEMDLAQMPVPFYRAQRLVPDEHIGGGYMHSGYPIMIHHSPTKRLLSNEIMANPELLMKPSNGGANWGFFHEIGHNMQNLNWVFGGTTEVSNNFFSLYMFDRLVGGRDGAHSAISSANTQKQMKKYFAEGASYEKWKSDAFLGLIMFRQMQEGFGWESFKTFFRAYQKLGPTMGKLNDQQKIDLWVSTYSNIVKRNLAPFWLTWGIPVSNAVQNDLIKYPKWTPFNFPPKN
ncbi:hypothetical protein ACVWYG_002904 [Pedobacter sp. UYEF25]